MFCSNKCKNTSKLNFLVSEFFDHNSCDEVYLRESTSMGPVSQKYCCVIRETKNEMINFPEKGFDFIKSISRNPSAQCEMSQYYKYNSQRSPFVCDYEKKALKHSLATANIKTTLLHHPQTYSDKKLWVDCVRRVRRMTGSWGLLFKCHSVQRRRLIPNCAWMCVNGSFCQRYCVRWSLTTLFSVLLCEWVKLCWRIQTNFQRCSKKKKFLSPL